PEPARDLVVHVERARFEPLRAEPAALEMLLRAPFPPAHALAHGALRERAVVHVELAHLLDVRRNAAGPGLVVPVVADVAPTLDVLRRLVSALDREREVDA